MKIKISYIFLLSQRPPLHYHRGLKLKKGGNFWKLYQNDFLKIITFGRIFLVHYNHLIFHIIVGKKLIFFMQLLFSQLCAHMFTFSVCWSKPLESILEARELFYRIYTMYVLYIIYWLSFPVYQFCLHHMRAGSKNVFWNFKKANV